MRKQSLGWRGVMDDIRRIATALQGIPRLMLNQGATTGAIIEGKASTVAHGMTDVADTDTFVIIQQAGTAVGGGMFRGFSEQTVAVLLQALATTDDTTKDATGRAHAEVNAWTKSGTNIAAPGADANVFGIRSGGNTRFIFDAEGSAHADVEWTTFEKHDDVALLDTLEETLLADRSEVPEAFGGWIEQNKENLEGLGIAHFDETPGHAMINWTRLAMLQVGALRQMGGRIEQLERALLEAGG